MNNQIELTKGKFTTIDSDMYAKLKTRRWHLTSGGYAASRNPESGNLEYMHRVITCAPADMVVDHIDGDKLNNTKENLRICTKKENSRYSKSGSGSSKYKGVTIKKGRKKPWRARIFVDGEQIILGDFEKERHAAQAYDIAAVKYFGEFALLNKVVCDDFVPFIPKMSSSGVRGVAWCNTKSRWRVTIQVNKKKIHLGYVKDIQEAIKIREEAEKKYFYTAKGEYNDK